MEGQGARGHAQLVDTVYAAFCASLPEQLAEHAKDLPRTLDLTRRAMAPWSEVFGQEVTLGMPALLGDAQLSVPPAVLRAALTAHALAVIHAFGTDRIADGQVRATPEVRRVLAAAARARDAALADVVPGELRGAPDFDGPRAEREAVSAIAEERAILGDCRPVSLAEYERVSLGKQAPGFPATLALAARAGWSESRREILRATLAGVWLGLQLHDDALDWEEDWPRGGAWAVSLALELHPGEAAPRPGAVASDLRARVRSAGVVPALLRRAKLHFAGVRTRASLLGAPRLAAWAERREAEMARLGRMEAERPGYFDRARVLARLGLKEDA